MEEELRRTFEEAYSFGRTCDALPDKPIAESKISGDDNLPIDDFEFAFTSVESDPGALTSTTADEIFSNGQILPVYPVFNRNLVTDSLESSPEEELVEGIDRLALTFEKRDLRSGSASSSSSIYSEADDPAAYCVWTPRSAPQSPDRWQKSSSTGSAESDYRRFRLLDLIINRSRSDGKEKLVALPAAEKQISRSVFRPNPIHKTVNEAEKGKTGKGKGKGKGKGGAVKEMDVVTAHGIYYGKGAADGRRSFLPYRQELLGGLFRHGKQHPF